MPPHLQPFVKSIRPVLRKYQIRKCAIFGSVARGEGTKRSDLDLLIDPPPRMTLFDLVGMEDDLKQAVGRKVDVVTFRSLEGPFKRRALKDAVVVYESRKK